MRAVIPCDPLEPLFSWSPPSWGTHLQSEQAPSSGNGMLCRLLASIVPQLLLQLPLTAFVILKLLFPFYISTPELMHLWGSLFSWGSVRSCVVVWRRAPFRLNIATHSLSSVREQPQEDLFLPLTDLVPQTSRSSVTAYLQESGSIACPQLASVSCSSGAHFKKGI